MAFGILCLHWRTDFFLKKLVADEVIKKLIRFNSTQSQILIFVLDKIYLLHSLTPKLYTVNFLFWHGFYGPLFWAFLFIFLDIHNFSTILQKLWKCWFSKKKKIEKLI